MYGADNVMRSYNFCISLAGAQLRACKVRNIERAVETEDVKEGGCNGYVHTFVTPAAQAKRLIFERGCCAGPDALVLEGLFGKYQLEPMLIAIYDRRNTTIQKAYTVEGWTIVKWELSELDAVENRILMETVEVVYETLRGIVF